MSGAERIGAQVAEAEYQRRGRHEVMALRYDDLAKLCTVAAERGATAPDLCPVCEEQPSSAGHSGCCDRWCEQDYFEEQARLRHAAPEVAELEP